MIGSGCLICSSSACRVRRLGTEGELINKIFSAADKTDVGLLFRSLANQAVSMNRGSVFIPSLLRASDSYLAHFRWISPKVLEFLFIFYCVNQQVVETTCIIFIVLRGKVGLLECCWGRGVRVNGALVVV